MGKLWGLLACPPGIYLPHEESCMKPPPQTGLALPCRAEGHTPGVPPGPEQSLGPHTVGRETREEPRREYISQPGGAWIFLQSSLQVSSTSPPWPLLPWGHGPSLHTPAAWCGPWGLGRHAPSDLPPILLPCVTLLLLPGRLQTRGGGLHCKPGSQPQCPPPPPHNTGRSLHSTPLAMMPVPSTHSVASTSQNSSTLE